MGTIKNLYDTNVDVKPVFIEPHSLAIRIWHWTLFVCLTASLVTVLLASTVFRTRNTIGLVQQNLQDKGVVVSQDQARAVAHAYSDKLWDLHTYLGYVLAGLLLCRIVIEITQPREEKLRVRLKRAAGLSPRKDARHYLWVKRGYLLFYLLIGMMALTGLGLAFEDVPVFKEWHRAIKQVHALGQYLIYGFILIHLIGVVRSDWGKHRGLVSGMIHGKGTTLD
jgi:Ni/Fe-hydrogenase 1 B-type cytochrome subunit